MATGRFEVYIERLDSQRSRAGRFSDTERGRDAVAAMVARELAMDHEAAWFGKGHRRVGKLVIERLETPRRTTPTTAKKGSAKTLKLVSPRRGLTVAVVGTYGVLSWHRNEADANSASDRARTAGFPCSVVVLPLGTTSTRVLRPAMWRIAGIEVAS